MQNTLKVLVLNDSRECTDISLYCDMHNDSISPMSDIYMHDQITT